MAPASIVTADVLIGAAAAPLVRRIRAERADLDRHELRAAPFGSTCAASLPWNIGRVKSAQPPTPVMPVTSVTSGAPRRAASSGAKSRV